MEDLMAISMAPVITRPNTGVVDEAALRRLHAEVRHRLRTADALISASRRAPRTLDEMRDRLPLPPVAATEEDLNKELDNPAEDWDQAVPRTVLPRAAGNDIFRWALVGGGVR
ncbi:hypothetical protein AB0G35_24160 [Streptomyces sp. NPDC021749]|uniref:hypothetical protein n=1 Tax=Streptomyces sp. NPDC021749 TaxID=3154905 RepID=UPI0033C0F6DC